MSQPHEQRYDLLHPAVTEKEKCHIIKRIYDSIYLKHIVIHLNDYGCLRALQHKEESI